MRSFKIAFTSPPAVPSAMRVTEEGIQRVEGLKRALVLAQRIGIDLHIVRAGHALDAVQRRLLAQHAGDIGCDARPKVRLAVAGKLRRRPCPSRSRRRKRRLRKGMAIIAIQPSLVMRPSESHTWS